MVLLMRWESQREGMNFSFVSSLWLLCFGGGRNISTLHISLVKDTFGDHCSQPTLHVKLTWELVKTLPQTH